MFMQVKFGNKGSTAGTFNGGGGAISKNIYNTSGGGATDIALYGTNGNTSWNNTNHLYSRLITAGGGGGGNSYQGSINGIGGYGGGNSGGTGNGTRTVSERGGGGTINLGGSISYFSGNYGATAGSFGCGGIGGVSGETNNNYHGSRTVVVAGMVALVEMMLVEDQDMFIHLVLLQIIQVVAY